MPESTKPADLLLPGEAGKYFRVDAKTVVRWYNDGRFPKAYEGRRVVVKTGGGHHRFDRAAIEAIAEGRLGWEPK